MPSQTGSLAHHVSDQDLTEARVHPLPTGEAAVWSSRCPGRDGPNEDGALLCATSQGAVLIAVADGVGGLRGGAEASRMALESLIAGIEKGGDNEAELRSVILDGLERANERILAEVPGAGTTVAIVEIQGRTVRPYHVGDSMILALGQRGRLKLQTVAHSPVGYAIESGLIDEGEALHHEERHLISNMVGSPSMRIEVGSAVELAPRDTLVVATDGLSDNLTTEEIVEAVRVGGLQKAAERAGRQARTRMLEPDGDLPSKPDDLTFVVYRPDR